MRVRLTAAAIVTALLGLAAALASSASAESTPSAFGSRLVTLINEARAQHGLHALTVAGGTSTVAANWTAHMVSAQALSHNPSLGSQLESHGSPNWTTYAENVAFGDTSSADAMFTNYMNSPEHRANILDSSMRYVGVGVVFSGSYAWNTLDFVDQYSSTSTTSAPKPAPAPAPAPTKTTTTTVSPKPHTQAPRTAPRTTTVKTVAKRTTSAPRTTVVRHSTTAAVAKPRAVAHTRPVTTHQVSSAAAPVAAHVMAAPSPIALSTPVHSGSDDRALVLIAGLGIALVALLRVKVARAIRR